MKLVNYQEQAELLADALNTILETTLDTDWADEEVMNQGWKVWCEYYGLTHKPPTMEQLHIRLAHLEAIIAQEKAGR